MSALSPMVRVKLLEVVREGQFMICLLVADARGIKHCLWFPPAWVNINLSAGHFDTFFAILKLKESQHGTTFPCDKCNPSIQQ